MTTTERGSWTAITRKEQDVLGLLNDRPWINPDLPEKA